MNTLEELLNENNTYYINKHCFGEYYGENEIETYICDQCGDWNGTMDMGLFSELFQGDVTSELELTYVTVIEENGLSHLFEVDEFDNMILKDKSKLLETIGVLVVDSRLYESNVCFAVEDVNYSIPLSEIPKYIIKDSLRALITNIEA